MSHLEYIYILNQDLTKFYKDPISPSPLSWNWDVLTGREVILWLWKHIFSTEDFLIHHILQIYILYNYYFVCVVQGGWRPSALYWPAATGEVVFIFLHAKISDENVVCRDLYTVFLSCFQIKIPKLFKRRCIEVAVMFYEKSEGGGGKPHSVGQINLIQVQYSKCSCKEWYNSCRVVVFT